MPKQRLKAMIALRSVLLALFLLFGFAALLAQGPTRTVPEEVNMEINGQTYSFSYYLGINDGSGEIIATSGGYQLKVKGSLDDLHPRIYFTDISPGLTILCSKEWGNGRSIMEAIYSCTKIDRNKSTVSVSLTATAAVGEFFVKCRATDASLADCTSVGEPFHISYNFLGDTPVTDASEPVLIDPLEVIPGDGSTSGIDVEGEDDDNPNEPTDGDTGDNNPGSGITPPGGSGNPGPNPPLPPQPAQKTETEKAYDEAVALDSLDVFKAFQTEYPRYKKTEVSRAIARLSFIARGDIKPTETGTGYLVDLSHVIKPYVVEHSDSLVKAEIIDFDEEEYTATLKVTLPPVWEKNFSSSL